MTLNENTQIVLYSNENIAYEIEYSLAKYCKTIDFLLSDSGVCEVRFPNINSLQLQKVVSFLSHHRKEMDSLPVVVEVSADRCDLPIEEKLRIDEYDKELFGNFQETVEVIQAADYLDCAQLYVSAIHWASVITSRTSIDGIYEMFGVAKPSNAEEEEIAMMAQQLSLSNSKHSKTVKWKRTTKYPKSKEQNDEKLNVRSISKSFSHFSNKAIVDTRSLTEEKVTKRDIYNENEEDSDNVEQKEEKNTLQENCEETSEHLSLSDEDEDSGEKILLPTSGVDDGAFDYISNSKLQFRTVFQY